MAFRLERCLSFGGHLACLVCCLGLMFFAFLSFNLVFNFLIEIGYDPDRNNSFYLLIGYW